MSASTATATPWITTRNQNHNQTLLPNHSAGPISSINIAVTTSQTPTQTQSQSVAMNPASPFPQSPTSAQQFSPSSSPSPVTPPSSLHSSPSAVLLTPSHVEYKVGTASQALIGRANQRYDGNIRLICGCVPFRLENSPMTHSFNSPLSSQTGQPNGSSSTSFSSSQPTLQSPLLPSSAATTTDSCIHSSASSAISTRSAPCSFSSSSSAPDSTPMDSPILSSPPCRYGHSVCHSLPQVLFLAIRSPDSWIFPKGGWETFETSEECALRESREEAGVDGNLVADLGSFDVHSAKGKYGRMKFYAMQVTTEYEEYADRGKRDRRWLTLEEAQQLIVREEMKMILGKAVEKMKEMGLIPPNG